MKMVRHFISTRLGMAYCRERGRQGLHELGCRRRRRRHRHLTAKSGEPGAVKAALEGLGQDWPEEWASLCVDEATVRRHPTVTAQSGLREEIPAGPPGDDLTKVHVDGAAAPLTGRTHSHMSREWGKGVGAPFLQHLLVSPPGKRLLALHDRGAQHQGALLDAVVGAAQGWLVLKAQPAYSPALTPPGGSGKGCGG